MSRPSPFAKRQNQLRKGVLLVNSHSRNGRDWFEQCRQTLLNEGVELGQAELFGSGTRLVDAARMAVKETVPLIIVGGGDGTIGSVAGVVANSQSTMAVLPLGTGNAFAHDLRIPISVEGACEVIITGRRIEVDLGKIQNRYFINVATVGLTTEIAEQLTNPMKKIFGRFAYAIAIARGIRHLSPFEVILTTENGVNRFECMQLVIGNGRLHAGPFPVLPKASLRTGKFSLYAVTGNRRSELIKYALLLPGGHHAMMAEVHSEYARRGSLTTRPSVKVILDGEEAMRTPITFEALPGALKVLAPADFDI